MDLNRAIEVTPEVEAQINDAFDYHAPSPAQVASMGAVRDALKAAFRVIVASVPPCPDRTVALRKLRDARMNANAAIVLGGKF